MITTGGFINALQLIDITVCTVDCYIVNVVICFLNNLLFANVHYKLLILIISSLLLFSIIIYTCTVPCRPLPCFSIWSTCMCIFRITMFFCSFFNAGFVPFRFDRRGGGDIF